MEKKILKAYQTIIYDDGTMETIDLDPAELTPGEAVPTLPKAQPTGKQPTGRIRQIIAVIEETQRLWAEQAAVEGETAPERFLRFDAIVTASLNRVAETWEVSSATVTDKLTRQLGYSHKRLFSQGLLAFLEGKENTPLNQNLQLKAHLDAVCKKEQDKLYKDEHLCLLEQLINKATPAKP